MTDFSAFLKSCADTGIEARVEMFEGLEHFIVEERPFEATPAEFRVSVYEPTKEPSMYHSTWSIGGHGGLGRVGSRRGGDQRGKERLGRLIRSIYGDNARPWSDVIYVVRRLPKNVLRLCASLGINTPSLELSEVARAIRAASFSRPVASPDFREIAAVAIELGHPQMEYWSSWAIDPDALMASEIASLRVVARRDPG